MRLLVIVAAVSIDLGHKFDPVMEIEGMKDDPQSQDLAHIEEHILGNSLDMGTIVDKFNAGEAHEATAWGHLQTDLSKDFATIGVDMKNGALVAKAKAKVDTKAATDDAEDDDDVALPEATHFGKDLKATAKAEPSSFLEGDGLAQAKAMLAKMHQDGAGLEVEEFAPYRPSPEYGGQPGSSLAENREQVTSASSTFDADQANLDRLMQHARSEDSAYEKRSLDFPTSLLEIVKDYTKESANPTEDGLGRIEAKLKEMQQWNNRAGLAQAAQKKEDALHHLAFSLAGEKMKAEAAQAMLAHRNDVAEKLGYPAKPSSLLEKAPVDAAAEEARFDELEVQMKKITEDAKASVIEHDREKAAFKQSPHQALLANMPPLVDRLPGIDQACYKHNGCEAKVQACKTSSAKCAERMACAQHATKAGKTALPCYENGPPMDKHEETVYACATKCMPHSFLQSGVVEKPFMQYPKVAAFVENLQKDLHGLQKKLNSMKAVTTAAPKLQSSFAEIRSPDAFVEKAPQFPGLEAHLKKLLANLDDTDESAPQDMPRLFAAPGGTEPEPTKLEATSFAEEFGKPNSSPKKSKHKLEHKKHHPKKEHTKAEPKAEPEAAPRDDNDVAADMLELKQACLLHKCSTELDRCEASGGACASNMKCTLIKHLHQGMSEREAASACYAGKKKSDLHPHELAVLRCAANHACMASSFLQTLDINPDEDLASIQANEKAWMTNFKAESKKEAAQEEADFEQSKRETDAASATHMDLKDLLKDGLKGGAASAASSLLQTQAIDATKPPMDAKEYKKWKADLEKNERSLEDSSDELLDASKHPERYEGGLLDFADQMKDMALKEKSKNRNIKDEGQELASQLGQTEKEKASAAEHLKEMNDKFAVDIAAYAGHPLKLDGLGHPIIPKDEDSGPWGATSFAQVSSDGSVAPVDPQLRRLSSAEFAASESAAMKRDKGLQDLEKQIKGDEEAFETTQKDTDAPVLPAVLESRAQQAESARLIQDDKDEDQAMSDIDKLNLKYGSSANLGGAPTSFTQRGSEIPSEYAQTGEQMRTA